MGIVTEEEHNKLQLRVKAIEERFGNMTYDLRGVVQSEMNDRMVVHAQSESQFGLYTALCIETIDIWKQNRIRFFCPSYHNPKRPVKEMPWAYPVSSMGGFDDCGLNWVPPAGSTVCILFEAGQRSSPYYIGTTWHRNRGPAGQHIWGFNIEEYYKVWEGHRKGYLVGPNDESQCFPPWNTESYNGYDLSSVVDFASDPEAQRKITYPNIYGFKTPEKHMIKMVDGDPKCNRRWKRFEIMSSCGNWIMLKDDHMHYGGQWAHPQCGVEGGDTTCIVQEGETPPVINLNDFSPKDGKKIEGTSCGGNIIGGPTATGHPKSTHYKSQSGANPYFKHQNECRPYQGPGTPMNNRCDLPQTGIQLMSISGHTLVFDDSVDEPTGEMTWERSLRGFDFGCTNQYQGRTYWKSATGHMIEMADLEDKDQQRTENNYIRLLSAAGNKIELNDHTLSGCIAGAKRGVLIASTAGHTFEMHDETNEQCSPQRMDGGVPTPQSKKAFVKIRTGYGLEIAMNDDNRQDKTVQQNIQIFCPQKDNKVRGPHIERFQEVPSGPGLIFLRAGGNYIIMTYDNMIEVVGDEQKNPSDKIEIITKLKLVYTKDMYLNVTEKSQIFLAKERILLLAGRDCPPPAGSTDPCGPCVGPVLVYAGGCVRLSDRVFASSSLDAPGASIFMFNPLIKCPPNPGGC